MCNMDDSQKHVKCEKPDAEGYLLYHSIYGKRPGKANVVELESRTVGALGGGSKWGLSESGLGKIWGGNG